MRDVQKLSLEEINQTVDTPKNASFFKTLLAFSGPGALVAVGYMDPGNWVTSVTGGAVYKYLLLSAILISSLMAMQLQAMSGKLGIVTRRDLAQMMAESTAKPVRYLLWVITELALMATDLAEVIGAGIALHLLFGWSLVFSILITVLDVFLLLSLMKFGFRKVEAIVVTLILTILIIFLYLVALSKPDIAEAIRGYIPTPEYFAPAKGEDESVLTLALGILGATVMPHNLFLHSSISQARKVDYTDSSSIKRAVRFMTWDSNIQLSVAFVVNCLLLILGAALFFGHSDDVGTFGGMYSALNNKAIAGAIATPVLSTLFAVALLASGQNSTITGTLTGEIVMEGFLNIKLPRWLRRTVTRLFVVVPVVVIAIIFRNQEHVLDKVLIYSQVFLSIALPFAIFPLVYFTSKKSIMGEFVNNKWNTTLAYLAASGLTFLNIKLIFELFHNK